MIKRIKKIIQTGVFRNSSDLGKFEFKKFTILYALNTYGKTTLKDILLSLTNDDPSILIRRKSIPVENFPQRISLSFLNNGIEQNIEFSDSWDFKFVKGKILIFDNDFIHRNLMTGVSITRENKEYLTDFILGEEGVALSENIRSLNKALQDKKNSLAKPEYIKILKHQKEIDDFLNLNITDNESELKRKHLELTQKMDNQSSKSVILSLPNIEIPSVNIDAMMLDLIEKVNTIFSLDFKEITKAAKDKISSHLKTHTNESGTESWVRQGLKEHMKSDGCPFCGQSLTAVQDLVDAYNDYFNEKYEIYSKKLTTDLMQIENKLNAIDLSIHKDLLIVITNLNKYKKYNPEINPDFDHSKIQKLENCLKEKLRLQKDQIKSAIANKIKEPHVAIPMLQLSDDFIQATEDLKTMLQDMEELKESINKASALKDDTALSSKAGSPDILKIELDEINRKMSRLAQDAACSQYLLSIKEIESLSKEITQETERLENEQSEYIDRYFEDLNKHFRNLGSNNFTLKSVTSKRGHKKVYEIKVFYGDKEIEPADVPTILSESDKRSLAFSIFFTKLKSLSNKSEITVVLDDPVVSFDDNRITASVDIFKEMCTEFSQIILLTHYPSLVKQLLSSRTDCAYLEIIKNSQTSMFVDLNQNLFLLSDMELAYEKISSYIARESKENISRDCRVFMEKYLKFRFKHEIKLKKIIFDDLSSLLDELKKAKLIKTEDFNKATNFRNSLNPDHHTFVFNKNSEDVITYATGLLDFLYKL